MIIKRFEFYCNVNGQSFNVFGEFTYINENDTMYIIILEEDGEVIKEWWVPKHVVTQAYMQKVN